MNDGYKIGRKVAHARQYTRDQDWNLANWIQGPVQVFRDHFRLGLEGDRVTKGDWIVQWNDGRVEKMDHKEFTAKAKRIEEDK